MTTHASDSMKLKNVGRMNYGVYQRISIHPPKLNELARQAVSAVCGASFLIEWQGRKTGSERL